MQCFAQRTPGLNLATATTVHGAVHLCPFVFARVTVESEVTLNVVPAWKVAVATAWG
jgi:hypothetical protein